MSIAAQITPHLPFLRRFARALSGSQTSGDNYVAALLEAMIKDNSLLVAASNVRVSLYQSLLKMWSSLDVNLKATAFEAVSDDADQNLQAITPVARQAFLLNAVEGFSREEVAVILERSPEDVDGLLDQASRDIAEQVATKVLIIEDEMLIALDIEDMVTGLGHEVTAIARTHTEALAALDRQRPGIVLADIQLADGSSGIDAVNDILKSIDVPVIFITAYPERLLTGDKPEPAYLVTKPFQPSVVSALISQALFFGEGARAKK